MLAFDAIDGPVTFTIAILTVPLLTDLKASILLIVGAQLQNTSKRRLLELAMIILPPVVSLLQLVSFRLRPLLGSYRLTRLSLNIGNPNVISLRGSPIAMDAILRSATDLILLTVRSLR